MRKHKDVLKSSINDKIENYQWRCSEKTEAGEARLLHTCGRINFKLKGLEAGTRHRKQLFSETVSGNMLNKGSACGF